MKKPRFFPYREDEISQEELKFDTESMRERLAMIVKAAKDEEARRNELDKKREAALKIRNENRQTQAKAATEKQIQVAKQRLAAYEESIVQKRSENARKEQQIDIKRSDTLKKKAQSKRAALATERIAMLPQILDMIAVMEAKSKKHETKINARLAEIGVLQKTPPAS